MNGAADHALKMLIESTLAQPASIAAQTVADAILAAHGNSVQAILFYGSCRRSDQPGGVLDFYVLVDRYRDYHGSIFRSLMNRLLPPDVSFMRLGDAAEAVAAKVTVISLDQFTRRVRQDALDTTMWARFTQPSSLLYAADDAAKKRLIAALIQAARTACGWAIKCNPVTTTSSVFWTQLFALTYGAELRVERGNRPHLIYDNDPVYYDSIFNALELEFPRLSNQVRGIWALRRYAGKILSVQRLCKGAFTFEGGVEYLLWKVERHSGYALALRPWQRRHPILAAPQLLYRLYRQGALR
ncbi:MAG: hypothetical protein Q7N95_13220 [Alphaproteobacteria bacterium]|nr:hypothetical protein [Alphaproteobacteria bacterium]